MGFVGFLRFSLLCLDFVAWPAFALIYPLWASIRAIETSSKYQMKKLVIYWTIFSLISLFEIFFVKLIQWVPFWAYIKLVSVFWLVMPRFDGACIAYKHLVHPCLCVSLQDISKKLSTLKENPYNEDSFLASAETYLKENGSEALEKLIPSKLKGKEHVLGDADAVEVVKRVEPTEKNVTAESYLVEQPKVLVESEEEIAVPESERVTSPGESKEKGTIETQALKKVQNEWTCAVCQLTTTTEATLNAHLQGKKHRSKCEKLKTNAQTKSNSEGLKTGNQTLNDLNKYSAAKAYNLFESEEDIEVPESQRVMTPGESKEKKPTETQALKNIQSEWTCAVCQLTTASEATLNLHLQGKKHKSKCEKLKTNAQTKSNFEELKTGNETLNDLKKYSTAKAYNLFDSEEEIALPEFQRVMTPRESKEKRPTEETQALKKVQSEWTCGVCQLSTTSEADLNSHLQGRKHRSNCEKLKTGNQTLNDLKKYSAAKAYNLFESEEETAVPESLRVMTPGESKEKRPTEETQAQKKVQGEWTCGVCQLSTTSKAALNSHLQGRKHRSKCEKLKTSSETKSTSEKLKTGKTNSMHGTGIPVQKNALVQEKQPQPKFWCSICNITGLGAIDMASHLRGKKHLFNLQSRI